MQNGLNCTALKVFQPLDLLKLKLVNNADMNGVCAIGMDVTGDLHHIVILQSINRPLIGNRQYHPAVLAVSDRSDEP